MSEDRKQGVAAMAEPAPTALAADSAARPAAAKPKAGLRCRAQWEPALRGFLGILERASSNGTISMEQVHRLATAFLRAEGAVGDHFARSENSCREAFAHADMERKRHDHLGRLVARPFASLFANGGTSLDRRHLPQFFTALHMMLGDDIHADLRNRARIVAESYRGKDDSLDWNGFHQDGRSQRILDQVRIFIAKSFRRFETRRDWFLLVMNQAPASTSLASNAFVSRSAEERSVPPFTEVHMLRLLQALFNDCDPASMSRERRATLALTGEDAETWIHHLRKQVRMGLARNGLH